MMTMPITAPIRDQEDLFRPDLAALLDRIATITKQQSQATDKSHKSRYGQYFTEGRIALQMSKMLILPAKACIGDHGAGTGILGATVLAHSITSNGGEPMELQAYEIDELLHRPFKQCLGEVVSYAETLKKAPPEIHLNADFTKLANPICAGIEPHLDAVILNPPYQKLHQQSELAQLMREHLVATPNLYAVFIVLSIMMLKPGGQLVAIVPRSFTSGSYFKGFRRWLREQGSIDWFVRYKRRSNLFRGDNVLQENVTFRFTKGQPQSPRVRISLCDEPDQLAEFESMVPASDVFPGGSDMIFVPASTDEQAALHRVRQEPYSLAELGVKVSTGKLDDFRHRDLLSKHPHTTNWAPVIYAQHWQKALSPLKWTPTTYNGKPACLELNSKTQGKVIPRGNYILIKRISANDGRTGRCNATVLTEDMDLHGDEWVVDNHIQLISGGDKPLSAKRAFNIAEYLTSQDVDHVLRLISGTTQLNRDDLHQLRFPARLI